MSIYCIQAVPEYQIMHGWQVYTHFYIFVNCTKYWLEYIFIENKINVYDKNIWLYLL